MVSKSFRQKRTEGEEDMPIRKQMLDAEGKKRERKEDTTVTFWRIILSNNSWTM